jgi:hypothetical protein
MTLDLISKVKLLLEIFVEIFFDNYTLIQVNLF